QVELDHLADPQEFYSTEWENESDELYNYAYEHAIGSPLNRIKIPYNTDVIYEEPYE
ncbi:Hypothetical predicted protein, partial [Paramuricea clavata]